MDSNVAPRMNLGLLYLILCIRTEYQPVRVGMKDFSKRSRIFALVAPYSRLVCDYPDERPVHAEIHALNVPFESSPLEGGNTTDLLLFPHSSC